MLSGVNIDFTKSIAVASGIKTIASGGVKDIEDIIKCKKNLDISGVIIGKAFYENNINLKEAINLSKRNFKQLKTGAGTQPNLFFLTGKNGILIPDISFINLGFIFSAKATKLILERWPFFVKTTPIKNRKLE